MRDLSRQQQVPRRQTSTARRLARWRWDIVLSVMGFAGLVFLVGVAVGKYQVFPYRQLDAAKDALLALRSMSVPGDEAGIPVDETQGGVLAWDQAAAQPGVTLILQHDGHGPSAVLLDMDGAVLHRWSLAFDTAFPEAPHIIVRGPDERLAWHGFHLFANGDLLVNFQGSNFPAGGGTVLLDQNSTVRWAVPRNTHHAVAVAADGRILVTGHRYNEQGLAACARFVRPPYYEDLVFTLSADGKVLDELSVLDALCRSPHSALLTADGTFPRTGMTWTDTDDPLHLNDVELVGPELAAVFPMARPGDILVSLRNVNTLALLDPATGDLRWAMPGLTVRQHDPDLLPDGHLLVFDNLGAEGERSRVVEIDPVTQKEVWSFAGADGHRLYTEKMGNQQRLANGNTLVVESLGGRILEVTAEQPPRVVWAYLNLIGVENGKGIAGIVADARRFDRASLTFLSDGKPEVSAVR
ncbi:MAG: arylsulfotransferase family protein [Geminicoccaceae bacterium]